MGVGEKTLRKLFHDARTQAPCIVFIDEIQALFCDRDTSGAGGGGSGSLTSTFCGCLDEVAIWNESVGASSMISILAATNEPWAIDKSLIRGGRFDRIVFVGPLDGDARKVQLIQELKHKEVSDINGFNWDILINMTENYTGADIAWLIRKAYRTSVFANRDSITNDDLINCIQSFIPSTDMNTMEEYERWGREFRLLS